MGDHEISIKLPGDRNEYLIIEEYNGIKSLVLANEGKDGRMWKKWGHAQLKDKKVAEKAIPWKISLGQPDDARRVAKQIAEAFGWVVQDNSAKTDKKPWTPPPDDDDGIPF